ncbi:MAG: arylsulfatase [Okeania sp. SIO2C9]|uniref:arylsulfatase n=1 Tax=Okeania sp. SIO2C9 TaxID=2607791 RepID=UPI0013C121F3|nr:arylsulfatase [Okeania sp. SIO2C9]NEQ72647.1 arylsulfatase [Okeania sp. SIO2C9]
MKETLQKLKILLNFLVVVIFSLGVLVPPALAQEILPQPDPEFKGDIGVTYETSGEPDKSIMESPKASDDAPNIVLVLLDDVGFSSSETFGGSIKTPTLEELADEGIIYNRFHTTALCSPTRAALLTGRNHHSVGSGVVQELATGYPGYKGLIPKSTATIAEILHENGYSTAWFGKNHNVPDNQTSMVGPFDRWPNGLGFDYFYGFIGGETDQWYPALYENQNPINPPATMMYNGEEDDYNLNHDLADKAIGWMNNQHSIAPDRPFFLYFAPGATHSPHQPPEDYRDKYKGVFDDGWDAEREKIFERQKRTGVLAKTPGIIPADAVLTPRPDEIPGWDDFDDSERAALAKEMEIYAAFLEYTDVEVGRVLDAIPETEVENTMIIYIVGDNGGSAGGGVNGTCNTMRNLNGLGYEIEEIKECAEDWGARDSGTSPGYSVAWAWATDAPFQWTKEIASHFGGTRNPMIIKWPKFIPPTPKTREIRDQFHHVIDIAPTILEVTGIQEPEIVNSIQQQPIEGVSLAYTFGFGIDDDDDDDDNDDDYGEGTEGTHKTQYFEMFGNRGIYKDEGTHEWMASTVHSKPVGDDPLKPFDEDEWELYDLKDDFSQGKDLSTDNPDKLEELKDLFLVEGGKYNVFPLDDRFVERGDVSLRPSFTAGRYEFEFYEGAIRLPEGTAPDVKSKDHKVTAYVTIPPEGAEGVLLALGGETGGYSFYIKDKKLHYTYNFFGTHYDVVSIDDICSYGNVCSGDDVTLGFNFEYSGNYGDGQGYPAEVTLLVNDEEIDESKFQPLSVFGQYNILQTVPARFSLETQDVGMDLLTPVAHYYDPESCDSESDDSESCDSESHFPFTGKINKVTIDLEEPCSGLDCIVDYAERAPFEFDGTINTVKVELGDSIEPYQASEDMSNEDFWDIIIQQVEKHYSTK